jgi:hypothetical protein
MPPAYPAVGDERGGGTAISRRLAATLAHQSAVQWIWIADKWGYLADARAAAPLESWQHDSGH